MGRSFTEDVEREDDGSPDGDAAYVASLERLASVRVDESDVDRTLGLILETAAAAVPGVAAASVSLRTTREQFVSVASSHDEAIELDHLQFQLHEGPCVDALERGVLTQIDDLELETRWPSFSGRAVRYGIRSILAVPLVGDGRTVGALSVFAAEAHVFDERAGKAAARIAVPAAAALVNQQAFERATELVEQLEQAMASRSVIEQAKGIVIARRRCDADAAFEVLKGISQRTNRKLRDVARQLVELHGGTPGAEDDQDD